MNKKHKNIVKYKNKKNEIKNDYNVKNTISRKKVKIITVATYVALFALIIRIGVIQFVDGTRFKELAYSQQAINQIISPKRGNIYDTTGKSLAISEQVDTITINPSKFIKEKEEDTIKYQELIAQGLSSIFSLDYQETLTKVQNTKSSVQTIIKKVEQDKVDELKKWMEENEIKVGINIDEDSKRYYPNNNLASQLIGFCGSDNQGLSGIEYSWDSVLTGTYGKLVSAKGGSQSEIPNSQEKYIEAQDGNNITLTIDMKIQSIVEKYLKQAVQDNSCSKGGNVIVMQPSTGDILAMASYPDYDLNNPYVPSENLKTTWDTLTDEQQRDALQLMWNGKSISDTYEPGSTFKIITAAVALEENITDTDVPNDFICTGVENVSGTPIKCWRANPHGQQTLKEAFGNSCNPAFMQLGKRIGATTLYKYYKAFGFFDKTGIGLSGEFKSIFHNLENVGPVELATMSFGQRIKITPLQLVTAVSAIVNDGVLMQPRIVKEITNAKTGAVTTVETKEVRQVISKQTSEKMKNLLEYDVTKGTGGNAAVDGYSVGGKTGTSEPIGENSDEGYVASFIGVSPVENTEIVILVTLYDPPKERKHQGGQIAAPVVSQMLTDILPYLGVPSDATENSNQDSKTVTLPDVTNKTVTEAKKILSSYGFDVQISVTGNEDSLLVMEQVPKAGTKLFTDSIIKLYSTENTTRTSVDVPDLKGMTIAQAKNSLKSKNLNIAISGSEGTVISQDYAIGDTVEEGTVITVTLKQTLTDAH